MLSRSIQKLTELFAEFPTVGMRTAGRFVLYLLKSSPARVDALLEAIKDLRENVALCLFCFQPFEIDESQNQQKLCSLCGDKKRDRALLCVVEKETDLDALEKTQQYHGLYFILGGTVGTLRKDDISRLRLEELKARLKDPEMFGISGANFHEIIIGVNLTLEGEATALYLERMLKNGPWKITRLGRGLPTGGEMEYADEETLRGALEGRR